MTHARPALTLALLLSPAVALACEPGPEGAAAMGHNDSAAWLLAGVTLTLGVGVVGASVWTRKLRASTVLALLLAIGHPRWWLDVSGGDCGDLLFEGSALVTAAMLLVALLALRRLLRPRDGAGATSEGPAA